MQKEYLLSLVNPSHMKTLLQVSKWERAEMKSLKIMTFGNLLNYLKTGNLSVSSGFIR